MKEYPNVGFLLVSRDREPSLLTKRLKEIDNQLFKAQRIIVCVARPEFVKETIEILEASNYKNFNVVQLSEFEGDDIEIIDECIRYNIGYLAVFESDGRIKKDFLKELNQLVTSNEIVPYVGPYRKGELSGIVIHGPLFTLLHGNKAVRHPDGTFDDRTFEERVAEFANKEVV
jgi:hypothetical protein